MAGITFKDNGEYKKRVSAATLRDIEGLDVSECGFCRDVSGDEKGCKADLKLFTKHVVVVTEQAPTEWDKMLKGGTKAETLVKTITDELGKGADIKVSMASFPFATPFTECDVIVFADKTAPYLRKSVSLSDIPSLVADLKAESPTTPNALTTAPAFALMCSHTKRDGRCGYAGPVLADLAQQEAIPNLIVGKISHVGGHMFAGNVLMYDSTGNDWFGYVTPDLLPKILKREWTPTITDLLPKILTGRCLFTL
eukprot:TRINITY_DN10748_c0_g2_i2.p1 TRINITY_DN10748_c0_g2~~TRINITY_DN10748_c0_g2_i2.p1  ORF type:complete len:269 (+),score=57.85 TRINITY_DN10748_c0_g2_i2:49-807(+)